MQYIALIHKDKDSDYGVVFPDFPGCVTAAMTIDEARELAKEALSFHIEGMIEDQETISHPISLEEIMKERENRDAIAFMVEVETPYDKYVRINITIPESVLKAATEYASGHGQSRSAFIVEAVRDALRYE